MDNIAIKMSELLSIQELLLICLLACVVLFIVIFLSARYFCCRQLACCRWCRPLKADNNSSGESEDKENAAPTGVKEEAIVVEQEAEDNANNVPIWLREIHQNKIFNKQKELIEGIEAKADGSATDSCLDGDKVGDCGTDEAHDAGINEANDKVEKVPDGVQVGDGDSSRSAEPAHDKPPADAGNNEAMVESVYLFQDMSPVAGGEANEQDMTDSLMGLLAMVPSQSEDPMSIIQTALDNLSYSVGMDLPNGHQGPDKTMSDPSSSQVTRLSKDCDDELTKLLSSMNESLNEFQIVDSKGDQGLPDVQVNSDENSNESVSLKHISYNPTDATASDSNSLSKHGLLESSQDPELRLKSVHFEREEPEVSAAKADVTEHEHADGEDADEGKEEDQNQNKDDIECAEPLVVQKEDDMKGLEPLAVENEGNIKGVEPLADNVIKIQDENEVAEVTLSQLEKEGFDKVGNIIETAL